MTIRAELDCLEHRGPKRFAVVANRVREADASPELGLFLTLRFKCESLVEKRDPCGQLVTTDGELGRAAQPMEGLATQDVQRVVVAGPSQIRIVWTYGLAVVMREDRGMLVPPVAQPIEPFGDYN